MVSFILELLLMWYEKHFLIILQYFQILIWFKILQMQILTFDKICYHFLFLQFIQCCYNPTKVIHLKEVEHRIV